MEGNFGRNCNNSKYFQKSNRLNIFPEREEEKKLGNSQFETHKAKKKSQISYSF